MAFLLHCSQNVIQCAETPLFMFNTMMGALEIRLAYAEPLKQLI